MPPSRYVVEALVWFIVWVIGAYAWDAMRKTWFPTLPALGQIG